MTTKLPADAKGITLGASAPWVRRNTGPVAWAVLETLVEHAVVADTMTVSYRSVRDLAGDLRLANDTVARALRRLADYGLVEHCADRSATGRFATGHYVLTLPPDVLAPTTKTEPTPPAERPTPPLIPSVTPRTKPTEHEQLDLLSDPANGPRT